MMGFYNRGFGDCFGFFGNRSGLGGIMMIVFAVLIIGVVYYLYHSGHKEVSQNQAMAVLDTRFANGEISEEEYLSKKKLLK